MEQPATQISDFEGKGLALELLATGERTAAVYEVLREWIVAGELAPGEEVSQLELGRRLGISRTPLREALRLLTRDGLVTETVAHRRVKVSALSMVDLDQLYALRLPAEALAIWQTVPKLTVADLVELRTDVDLVAKGDTIVARDAHRRYHARLAAYAGTRVQDALRGLVLHSERYHRAFVNETAAGRTRKASEHRAIVRACEIGDRTLARELLVSHIASTAIGLMDKHGYRPVSLPAAMRIALSDDIEVDDR